MSASWSCKSRVVGVTMPPQIGDAFFILGQPVFHRYYVAFDYDGPRLGFGLAAARSVEASDEEWMVAEEQSTPQAEACPADLGTRASTPQAHRKMLHQPAAAVEECLFGDSVREALHRWLLRCL